MTEADVAEVARLDQAIFFDEASDLPFRETRFREELSRPFALVLVATLPQELEKDATEEQVAGYLVAWLAAGEGHLLNVAVAESERRKGLAGALLRTMLEHPKLAAAEVIVLEVRASNAAAQAFYARAGFVLSRRRRSYYPNGEDALELVLTRD